MKRFCMICLVLGLAGVLPATAPHVIAQQSEQYKIENGKILQDSNSYLPENSTVQMNDQRNSRISSQGFSALVSDSPIRISIPRTSLDYGNSPFSGTSVKETPVKILYTGDGGFVLVASSERGTSRNSIFNTTGCSREKGAKCFETYARPWQSDNSYGYGYNVEGNWAEEDFLNSFYYRPFQESERGIPGVIVAQGQGDSKQVEVTFRTKLNSSASEQGTSSKIIHLNALVDW